MELDWKRGDSHVEANLPEGIAVCRQQAIFNEEQVTQGKVKIAQAVNNKLPHMS